MKKDLSPALLNLVGGIFIILVVCVGMGYLYYSANKTEKTDTVTTAYPTSVLADEFGPDGVFLKTATLKSPGSTVVVAATATPLPTGSVGKKDIGSIE